MGAKEDVAGVQVPVADAVHHGADESECHHQLTVGKALGFVAHVLQGSSLQLLHDDDRRNNVGHRGVDVRDAHKREVRASLCKLLQIAHLLFEVGLCGNGVQHGFHGAQQMTIDAPPSQAGQEVAPHLDGGREFVANSAAQPLDYHFAPIHRALGDNGDHATVQHHAVTILFVVSGQWTVQRRKPCAQGMHHVRVNVGGAEGNAIRKVGDSVL